MTGRRPTRAQAAKWRASLDLFGEVPVTRPDVYAWLLGVADMDPASFRAEGYMRVYRVLDKIVTAKLEGTFDALTAPARKSARFRELAAAGRAVIGAANPYAVGGVGAGTSGRQLEGVPRMLRRSPQEVKRERARDQADRRSRRKARASMLHRLPGVLPPLSVLLADIGGPSAEALAGAMRVSASTARRWLREDDAPHSVLLALFWVTRWGMSAADANAFNDAVNSARVAGLREGEAKRLREDLSHVERLADFGSANDPLPTVSAQPARSSYAQPADLPIVFTSLRRAPCADAGRKKSA